MTTRLRLVGWTVQPVVMTDDGENLTPLQVAPVTIPADQWATFKDGGDAEALGQLRAQVEVADQPSAERD